MNIGKISHTQSFHPLAKMSAAATATAETAQKVAAFSNATFTKAVFMTRITLHTAFGITAHFLNNAAKQIKTIAGAIFGFAKNVVSALKPVCEKIAQIAVSAFQKMAPYLAIGWAHLKAGAVKGFEFSKGFYATHQKETLIAGAAFIIGSAITGAICHAGHSARIQTA